MEVSYEHGNDPSGSCVTVQLAHGTAPWSYLGTSLKCYGSSSFNFHNHALGTS
jgi:hypothetical protein